MAYMLSIPVGFVLGGAFGYVRIKHEALDKTAGSIFSAAGAVTTIICLVMGFSSASSREFSILGLVLTIASPWCLVPLLGSLVMLVKGWLIVKATKTTGYS